MVESFGVLCKRPFCWLLIFSVDKKPYAVGSIYFDKTNTRHKEWYDKYFIGLYELKDLIFNNDKLLKKELVDISFVNSKKPIKDIFFPFYKTFSPLALEHDDDYNMTSRAKVQYELEENTIIFQNLLVSVFPKKYHKQLFESLFE
jgi:hypothetical protein